jgi:hypothetical protein
MVSKTIPAKPIPHCVPTSSNYAPSDKEAAMVVEELVIHGSIIKDTTNIIMYLLKYLIGLHIKLDPLNYY